MSVDEPEATTLAPCVECERIQRLDPDVGLCPECFSEAVEAGELSLDPGRPA